MRQKSTRTAAKGRWRAVYRLGSYPLAVAFLKRPGVPPVAPMPLALLPQTPDPKPETQANVPRGTIV